MPRSLGNDLTLGHVVGRNPKLMLSAEARSMHLHVSGATGTGKSKFLEHLIRQDILNWRKTECGLMLLDPHGALYDGIVRWLAPLGLNRLKIIPIDLRRDDWIVSYNLLRKRSKVNPAVIVDNIVDAMAHVWGASGTDQTPLFARWASNLLYALYAGDYSLADATFLTDSQDAFTRNVMTRNLTNPLVKQDWLMANRGSAEDFDQRVSSTLNRLGRFLRNDVLRAIFGQTDVSLDLGQALREGHIVLVRLGTEGARVSREDSELFATLLLNDLWTSAQERGKHENNKPFYVYIDEFQKFVSPTISENLDEARVWTPPDLGAAISQAVD